MSAFLELGLSNAVVATLFAVLAAICGLKSDEVPVLKYSPVCSVVLRVVLS